MNFSKNVIVAIFLILFLVSITAVSAHDSDNPGVLIDTPTNNEEVSGEVDINVTIDDHYETQHVNFTIEGIDNVYSWSFQDKNPSDGWHAQWDTSNCSNGRYYIQAKAINSLGLTGDYNVFVTLANTQRDVNLNVDNVTAAVNQQVNIIARLLDENSKGVSNKNIEFLIDENRFSALTDSNGIASFAYTPSKAGKYDVLSSFGGDNIYGAVNVTSSLTAVETPIQLTINPITAENGEKINLTATLTSSIENTSLSNKTVNFNVDGDFVGSAISNDEGIAALEYSVSKTGGNYVYSASINDTDNQNSLTATNLLYVPRSELYVTLTSDKSGVKVGDEVTITYNVFNNGPDSAKNTVFKYVIPDSLKYISADVTTGDYYYNSSNKEITWNLGSIPVGKYSLYLKMQAISPARNNLTASLTTDTYDESIANAVPTRYLTVEGEASNNNSSDSSEFSYGGVNYSGYSNLGVNNSGNPILILLCSILMLFVGFKFKR
ncbi:Ig-like domain-containing protein [Methanobrevibacter sp.]|uniref:DUF11 domain-containing protein n=1 Tax=Methanobrevibacter sp. TaxID=66852 RepID=UPI00388F3CCA